MLPLQNYGSYDDEIQESSSTFAGEHEKISINTHKTIHKSQFNLKVASKSHRVMLEPYFDNIQLKNKNCW